MEVSINDCPIFVYGTLMRGRRASHMLAGATFAGLFQLKDYAMYHLGRYPGIVPCRGETVYGELYYVNREMLAQMDAYEEEGSLYLRRTVQLVGENGPQEAQAYIYNRDVTGCRLLRCAWSEKEEGHVQV
jgi:gamma-glutamylcyclotransferase (GGCT)/AIG2-like uncharacterized protein YtfP